jgi:hypothetical protein
MITSPINDLYYSFSLFLDHAICQKGKAFTNINSLFYKVNDPELPNLSVYAAPFKQNISDFSVSGAQIPTGLYVNNVFCPKGQSGLIIDYINNRAILSGSHNNLSISGSYSVKDFNVYATTNTEEELIYENAFQMQASYSKPLSGLAKYSLTVPGIFITNSNFTNETYAFGGLVETTVNINCIILSDSKDQLDAVGSLLTDEKYSYFPVVDSGHIPYNYYGDYRTTLGNYNYLNYVNQFPNNVAYISDVDFYKLSNRDFSNRYPDLRAAFADFQIKYVRFPNHKIT